MTKRRFDIVPIPEPTIEIGEAIKTRCFYLRSSDARMQAEDVNNPEIFGGALLAIVVDDGRKRVLGTAFFVAPGIAITATHVLRDDIENLMKFKKHAFCFGLSPDHAMLWTIRHINVGVDDDITFLSLIPRSELPGNKTLFQFPITTRTPRIGESLHIAGFTDGRVTHELEQDVAFKMKCAVGSVSNVYPDARDSVLMPFPTIEIDCGSIGGMSGGAVIDTNGFVCGVICRGLHASDGHGPTYANWIISSFAREIEIAWPPGLYKSPQTFIDIERITAIQGRDKVTRTDDSVEIEMWHE